MMIIHGAQSLGKSIVLELFCELFGKYALANVDDLDNVFGKFNNLLSNHLLININEPPEADDRFRFNGQIKSKLSQKKMVQEMKGVDQIEILSWCNFCMTTNNPNPVREEKDDRRIVYFETNNKRFGDRHYFDELCKLFQPTPQGDYDPLYMGTLLHYLKTQVNVSDFHPEDLIRAINARTSVDYNENIERQYDDLNAVDNYVVNHSRLFKRGIAFSEIPNIESYKRDGIAKKLRAICDVMRMTTRKYIQTIALTDHGSIYEFQVKVYTLKPQEQIPDLYAIIEYKEFQNASLVDDEEETADDDIPVKGQV